MEQALTNKVTPTDPVTLNLVPVVETLKDDKNAVWVSIRKKYRRNIMNMAEIEISNRNITEDTEERLFENILLTFYMLLNLIKSILKTIK